MLKQLWKSIGELKTPERRLLFGLMLFIIVVLWMALKDGNNDKIKRIDQLEKRLEQSENARQTDRILLQDKIDQCQEERYNDLKAEYNRSEKMKIILTDIK